MNWIDCAVAISREANGLQTVPDVVGRFSTERIGRQDESGVGYDSIAGLGFPSTRFPPAVNHRRY